jgi:hypothetical protein
MRYGKIAADMYPQRIVCLTEETTETLDLLGEERRIVGISGFTVRPPRARQEKPRVSAFTSARFDKIAALKPDLVLGFSDLQADIAADLIRLGIAVHVFNQRSIAGILQMILVLGGLVGCQPRAMALVDGLESELAVMRQAGGQLARRPRVYFEEWDEPQISCIQWVSELVELAGGTDCFPELAVELAVLVGEQTLVRQGLQLRDAIGAGSGQVLHECIVQRQIENCASSFWRISRKPAPGRAPTGVPGAAPEVAPFAQPARRPHPCSTFACPRTATPAPPFPSGEM